MVVSNRIGSRVRHRLACGALALAFACTLLWTAAKPVSAQSVPLSNEFIVRAPAARIQDIASRHGLTVIRQLPGQDAFLVGKSSLALSPLGLPGGTGSNSITALGEFEADPDILQAEPNSALVTPEVAAGINLNGSLVSILDALSAPFTVNYSNSQVWIGYVSQPATAAIRLSYDGTHTGSGIVAVIDTGVDPNHPVLAGSLVPGYDFIHDTAGGASEWTDLDGSLVSILDGSLVSILDSRSVVKLNGSTAAVLSDATARALSQTVLPHAFGHGTMVAGLVHLVAPTARIMPLKAFRADGTSTVFDVVRAIYYAVDHGARIINMSFSAEAASPEITHAINVATSKGVICLASAGNLGQETLAYPGALRNVLGVGSTTSTNPPSRSLFSNYGDALVSLGAPGEEVITTYPGGGYAAAWGTSFSTPLAAGAAALLLQADPQLDQARAADILGKADAMQGGMGKGRLNLTQAVSSASDTVAPAISIVTPANGGALFGTVLISASASDNIGVAGVKFLLDDHPFGNEVIAAPFEEPWSTATASNGRHVLTAIARDAAGNVSSSVVSVTVSNDTAPPTVALASPASGATVSGTVTLTATASDDLEVFGVRFTVDGAPLGAEVTVAPYQATWTTTTNGSHTVAAIARDAAGHEATASAVVTVANDLAAPTVTMTRPATGATVAGMVAVGVAASDDVGVVGVQFAIDGASVGAEDTVAPYELVWNSANASNGAHLVTAVARDAAGHEATASAAVTVANDNAPPAVALDTPVAGATVAGIAALLATASDDIGVVGVQFRIDGAPAGPEYTTAPYELLWNTADAVNGPHTVTAIARDGAGHETMTSAQVMVVNDAAPPTVALASPATGATLGGIVSLVATASDDVGVVEVQFKIDGALVGIAGAEPYELLWHTADAANGPHTVTVVARDGVGHEATTIAEVIVLNDDPPPIVSP